MTEAPSVRQMGDSVVIRGREALDDIAKCVLAQIRESQRNGYSIEPYARLLRTIHTARMSPPRHEFASHQVLESHSGSQDGDDLMDANGAAAELSMSIRQVQRLAPGLGAVRVGRSWAFKRAPVLALAAERKRKAANGQRQGR